MSRTKFMGIFLIILYLSPYWSGSILLQLCLLPVSEHFFFIW